MIFNKSLRVTETSGMNYKKSGTYSELNSERRTPSYSFLFRSWINVHLFERDTSALKVMMDRLETLRA